jgi:hypothetical protein
MKYSEPQVPDATAVMEKYRGSQNAEIGAALVVVGLGAERAAKEPGLRRQTLRACASAWYQNDDGLLGYVERLCLKV